MSAWATGPEEEKGSWTLVRFIRQLPQLTEAERKQMETLNPKGPGEMNMQSKEAFLKGDDAPAKSPQSSVHGGHKTGEQSFRSHDD